MPIRSGRNDTPILTLALIISILISGMIGYFQGLDGNLRLEHDERVEEHQQESARSIEDKCFGTPEIVPLDCIQHELRAYSDIHGRSEDLAAQKGMAFWAKALLFLSVVTTATAVVGLIYIRVTFLATLQMAVDTRLIGEKQIQAYVGVKSASYHREEDGTNVVRFEIVNSGQSPALNVVASASFKFFDQFEGKVQAVGNPLVQHLVGDIPSTDRTFYVFEVDPVDIANPNRLNVEVTIRWHNVFDDLSFKPTKYVLCLLTGIFDKDSTSACKKIGLDVFPIRRHEGGE